MLPKICSMLTSIALECFKYVQRDTSYLFVLEIYVGDCQIDRLVKAIADTEPELGAIGVDNVNAGQQV